MEHRDKIASKLSGKEIFLQNSLVEYEKPNIYSLEAEFAKTKKNQDLKPYLIFFSFIILLILFTVVTTNYLEVKSKQVNIDISDFEDLRLKETLSAAKEKEQELNRKTEELNDKKGELKNLQSSFNSEVLRIKEELQKQADLKNADKKALQRLDTKSKKQVEDLKKQYEKQYAQMQTENEALKQHQKEQNEQIKQYKTVFDQYQNGLISFLKGKKAVGCVIGLRQRGTIIVFIPKAQKVATATLVELYREKDEYIGKLKLIPGETDLQVKVVEVAKHQSIMPMDWFRLAE